MTTRTFSHLLPALAICLSISSCSKQEETPDQSVSLSEARSGFKTTLLRKETADFPAEEPPARLFELVQYRSGDHEFPAYLSPDPVDGEKHPAIIWMVGGFHNSISGNAFESGPRENDQSGATFRKAGIVMMYPSLRGGNENEGSMEGFYGEVDDVLAAADHLKSIEYVDPERIYLGGHSTGGTLALLAAAAAPENTFRAVFALGPIDDPVGYGEEHIPYDPAYAEEQKLRAPIQWLHSITAPTLAFEGEDGNADSLRAMRKSNSNPRMSFFEIGGAGHFDIIAPISELIAESILADTGPEFHTGISVERIKQRLTQGDAALLDTSAQIRAKLPELKKDHQSGLEPGEYILVKAPFAVPGGGNEYMWVEVQQWGVREVRGSLRSDPINIPDLKAGQVVTISEAEIFDYIRRFSDGTEEGNETGN